MCLSVRAALLTLSFCFIGQEGLQRGSRWDPGVRQIVCGPVFG